MGRTVFAIGLLLSAVGLAALVIALGRLTIDPTVSETAGAVNLARLWPFWIASAVGWSGLTAVWVSLRRDPAAPAATWTAIVTILIVAAAARVAVIAVHEPALSDDVYRYVFDGRNLAAGENPYLARPATAATATEEAWPGQRETAARVNNPELSTIYLPTSQWIFAAVGKLVPDDATVSGAVRAYRLALTLLELVAIGLLIWILARGDRSPWWATLYAWHPLAVTEIAGTGHQESVGIVMLMVAMAAWTLRPRRIAAWTVPLAAATLVKPIVLPVAPLLLRGRSWRVWAGSAAIGAVTCVLLSAPLLSGDALRNLRETSTRFTLKWAHFGSVYEPWLWIVERLTPSWGNDPQEQLARLLCTATLVAIVAWILIRARDAWAGIAAMFLAMVLLSPSAHPWYLLWALIAVPMAPGAATWTASLTISWGYVAWRYAHSEDGGVGWGVSPWVMVVAYAPVYLALITSLIRRGPAAPAESRA